MRPCFFGCRFGCHAAYEQFKQPSLAAWCQNRFGEAINIMWAGLLKVLLLFGCLNARVSLARVFVFLIFPRHFVASQIALLLIVCFDWFNFKARNLQTCWHNLLKLKLRLLLNSCRVESQVESRVFFSQENVKTTTDFRYNICGETEETSLVGNEIAWEPQKSTIRLKILPLSCFESSDCHLELT